ncbi:MAG: ABC transporter ATP-binding protein/permease [Pseudomonadales bacterium]
MHGHHGSAAASGPHDWDVIKGLIPYLMRHRGRVLAALALLVAAKLSNVLVPVSLKFIVDALDVSLTDGVAIALVVPVALVLGYGALRFGAVFFGELRDTVFAPVAERTLSEIGLAVFSHLHKLDLAYHLDRRTGGLSRDMDRGTSAISFLLRSVVFSVVPILLEVLFVAAIMAISADTIFAVVVLVSVVVYIVFSVWMTNKRTEFIRAANIKDSQANTRAIDSLLNYETVKYFNNEQWEQDRYGVSLREREQAKIKNLYSLAVLNSGQALIIGISVMTIMWLAAARVAAGTMTLGDLAMVNAFMLQVFIPLNALGFIYREVRRTLTDVEAMFNILDIQPAIKDTPDAVAYQAGKHDLSFQHVSFAYNPDRPILKDISFTVPTGQKVAIVGPSGAGKSTLARLLFRFYDIDEGVISVGGQDIRHFTLDSWRAQLGTVPQDTVLFNDTIGSNIHYGRPSASQAEVDEVIGFSHLEGFVASLPAGLDTMVGERGLKVSGGEKQRIAIARMLLKNPAFMVFDEATSSLDSAAEQAIGLALDEVARNHTTLVIAHRLSTVVDADNIIVLEQGRIVESGNHAELMASKGLYYSLWQLQQREQR